MLYSYHETPNLHIRFSQKVENLKDDSEPRNRAETSNLVPVSFGGNSMLTTQLRSFIVRNYATSLSKE